MDTRVLWQCHNGQWPRVSLSGGRAAQVRFRILNASNARFYGLTLSSGEPFYQIGTDQGLLPAPVAVSRHAAGAPSERVDVVIDFTGFAGKQIVVNNDAACSLSGRRR